MINRRTQTGVATAVGAAIVMVIVVISTAMAAQLAMVSHVQTTLTYAALMGARAGAVEHASASAIEKGVANGLAPLFAARAEPDAGADTELVMPELSDLGMENGDHRRQNYARTFPWGTAAPANRTPAADGNGPWAVAASEFDRFGDVVILNPVVEAFDDFGGVNDGGHRAIPSRGLWRRTGIPMSSPRKETVQQCEKTVIPAADNPTKPPQFSPFSTSEMITIINAFTWNSTTLKQETFKDDKYFGVGLSTDLYREPSNHKYVEQQSGPYGKQLRDAMTDVVQRLGYSAPDQAMREMGAVATQATQDASSEFNSGSPRSAEYCSVTFPTGYCDKNAKKKKTLRPGDPRYLGPIDRFQELSEFLRAVNASPGSLGITDAFGTLRAAFANAAANRRFENGAENPGWQSFREAFDHLVATEMGNADDSAYSRFIQRAGSLAKKTEAQAGEGALTATQVAYLDFLKMLANKVKSTYEKEEIVTNCKDVDVEFGESNRVGENSEQTIQDANLLRVLVIYGYKPFFSLPESVYLLFGPGVSEVSDGAFPESVKARIAKIRSAGRQPLYAVGVVRMQSDPFLNDKMLSKRNRFFRNRAN